MGCRPLERKTAVPRRKTRELKGEGVPNRASRETILLSNGKGAAGKGKKNCALKTKRDAKERGLQ